MDSETGSEDSRYWTDWFLNLSGNDFYCEVDQEYILDRFNLTGLTAAEYFQEAFELITDNLENEFDTDARFQIEKAARELYGLIHARFLLTSRGAQKMGEKFKRGDFGRCPRALCNNTHVLPIGLTDIPKTKTVKVYCPKCQDVYYPRSNRYASIDGAHFGTSFPHILFQVYPKLLPSKSIEKFTPRIYGFKIHPSAELYEKNSQKNKTQNTQIIQAKQSSRS